jgi:hypothetical protein
MKTPQTEPKRPQPATTTTTDTDWSELTESQFIEREAEWLKRLREGD